MMASSVLHDPEWHTRTGAFSHFGVGRLKPGVSVVQAQTELTALTRQLEETDPIHHRDFAAAIFPSTMVPMPFRGFVKAFTAVLMAGVFMVLLIACANAANLMLARAVSRRREVAVRASIGASRWRLMRQLLIESVLLALLAGGLGLLLTSWFGSALMQLVPPTLPIRPEFSLDMRVLAFTTLISLLTAILFGLVPAWQGTKVDLASALKDESPTGTKHSRFADVLVAGQVAVCLVLLIAGALCLRSLFNAQRVNLGFDVQNRVTAEVNLKDYGYSEEQVNEFNAQFTERVAAFPNVQSVAIADFLPLDSRYLGISYNMEGREPPPGQDGFGIQTFNVGPDYFTTMGTRLVKGREFNALDRKDAPGVAIVNQALANQFWPGQDPIGRRLTEGNFGQGTTFEVVGVVETGKYRTLDENPQPVVFRCRLQERGPRSTFVAHVRGDPQSTLVAIRGVTRSLIRASHCHGWELWNSTWLLPCFQRELRACSSVCLVRLERCWPSPVCWALSPTPFRSAPEKLGPGCPRCSAERCSGDGCPARDEIGGCWDSGLALVVPLPQPDCFATCYSASARSARYLHIGSDTSVRGRATGLLHPCAASDKSRSDGGAEI